MTADLHFQRIALVALLRKMENSDEVVKPLDAVIIIQDRKNVDWDQEEVAGRCEGLGKASTLKVEPTGFILGLDVRGMRERGES